MSSLDTPEIERDDKLARRSDNRLLLLIRPRVEPLSRKNSNRLIYGVLEAEAEEVAHFAGVKFMSPLR
jgi:hypothetical protein